MNVYSSFKLKSKQEDFMNTENFISAMNSGEKVVRGSEVLVYMGN